MKKPVVITEVTRMQEGRVCIAGYDQQGHCLRPVLPPPGIHESTLYAGSRPIIFPSAKVEFAFTQPAPQPPHTEDIRYDPAAVRLIERQPEDRWHKMLQATVSSSVAAIFEQPIHSEHGYYLMAGRGSRSLGTIRPARILRTIHEFSQDNKKWKYRIGFVDNEQATYWLTVTDLAWRYFHDRQRQNGCAPADIASEMTVLLKSREILLRIGLARGWEEHPDRCYIQLTGVYTFPDYLEGKTFADFAPKDT
jgi:hypothetical protein